MQFVGKCQWEIAHFTRKELVFLHGGLVIHAPGLLSCLLHACIELKKSCVGRGTPNRGRLKMHDLVAWEGVKWGHSGRPFHPALEARSSVAVLPEVRQHMHIVRKDMRTLRELCVAWEVSCVSSGNVSGQ